MKMKQKWNKNEAKNGPKMATVNNPIIGGTAYCKGCYVEQGYCRRSRHFRVWNIDIKSEALMRRCKTVEAALANFISNIC